MFALLDNHATGMPMLDAQSDFRRARRAHGVARLSRWLTRRQGPSHPPTLGDDPMTAGGPLRLKVVALALDRRHGRAEPPLRRAFSAGLGAGAPALGADRACPPQR